MYRIQGADQKEYGPISAEQIRAWAAENRLNRFTLCAGEDGIWKPLGQFSEFANLSWAGVEVATPPAGGGGSVGASVGTTGSGAAGDPGEAGREVALRKVNGPAICMLVLAGVSALMTLSGPITKKAQLDFIQRLWPQAPSEVKKAWAAQASAGFGLVDMSQMLVVLLCCGVVVFGALKMRKLESFAWSVVATAFSMVFCTGCCCGLGLAAGVWSLMVINSPDVRRYFKS